MDRLLQQHLHRAQHRMKMQADKGRTDRSFQVGDSVYLKLQTYVQSSLAPRANQKLAFKFFGPYKVIGKVGPVAYKLQLPSSASIHDVFHVSQLRKCVKIPEEIIKQHDLEIEPDLSYVEYPMKILDSKKRSTRREKVRMYNIQWKHRTEEEATWETEHYLQQNFSDFLSTNPGI